MEKMSLGDSNEKFLDKAKKLLRFGTVVGVVTTANHLLPENNHPNLDDKYDVDKKEIKSMDISERFSMTAPTSSYTEGILAVTKLIELMGNEKIKEVDIGDEKLDGVSEDINFLRDYIRRFVFDSQIGGGFQTFQDLSRKKDSLSSLDLMKIIDKAEKLQDKKIQKEINK